MANFSLKKRHLFARVTGREFKTEIFHLPVHSFNAHNNQAKVRNSGIQPGFPCGGGNTGTSSCISMKLDWKSKVAGTQIRNMALLILCVVVQDKNI